MKENEIIIWLKRIFSLKTLEILLAIGALIIGYYQFIYQKGGDLDMVYDTRPVDNNGQSSLIVCADSRFCNFSDLPLSPDFVNNTEHSIREFQLQYHINTTGLDIEPSINYRIVTGPTIEMRYLDNIIYSYSGADSPIRNIKLTSDNATCKVSARASYDGAKHRFDYTINSQFIVVPRYKNETKEHWIVRARKKISELANQSVFNTIIIFDDTRQFESNVGLSSWQKDTASVAKEQIKPSGSHISTQEAALQHPQESDKSATQIKQQHTDNDINIIESVTRIGDSCLELKFFPPINKPYEDVMVAYNVTSTRSKSSQIRLWHLMVDKDRLTHSITLPNYNIEFIEICKEDSTLESSVNRKKDRVYKNTSSEPIGVLIKTDKVWSTDIINPHSSTVFSNLPENANIIEIHYYRVPDKRSWADKFMDTNIGFIVIILAAFILGSGGIYWGFTDKDEILLSRIGYVAMGIIFLLIGILLSYMRWFE